MAATPWMSCGCLAACSCKVQASDLSSPVFPGWPDLRPSAEHAHKALGVQSQAGCLGDLAVKLRMKTAALTRLSWSSADWLAAAAAGAAEKELQIANVSSGRPLIHLAILSPLIDKSAGDLAPFGM